MNILDDPQADRASKCPACDRWRFTQADLNDHENVHGPGSVCVLEPCTFRDWLCWEGQTCDARRIDWRERALKAEEAVRDLTHRLAVGGARPAFIVPPHAPALGSIADVARRLAKLEDESLAVFVNGLAARVAALEDKVTALVAKSEGHL